ncbi:MAG: 4-hydroxy-3-methylbut-2-enyl diphosphate reductase [Hydrotalea sp.]|nr:4-hydroxy-3-methylbut-2-enyl diphosphate reductase [Hydrotalea sp.]
MPNPKPPLEILLAAPRGFCAGVERAIEIVELAIERYGAPVYVRHEIVHNVFVVERLRSLGAVFVKELTDIPDTDQPVIFSAHGVPQSVPAMARHRNLFFLDATCPLVSKVHRETIRHVADGRIVLLIGHKHHPEVIGTMGQVEEGRVLLIETKEDIDGLDLPDSTPLAYATQTTLSVSETAAMINLLRQKFPDIVGPKKEDICYATTNRQRAVAELAKQADYILVVGSQNSSNSKRLLEVGLESGIARGKLINSAQDIDYTDFDGAKKIALTAGASAPDELVMGVINALKEKFAVTLTHFSIAKETINFKLPRELITLEKKLSAQNS